MTNVIIKFDRLEAADHFVTWMCEAGEQDYWNWMEYRQQESSNPSMTATTFEYPGGLVDGHWPQDGDGNIVVGTELGRV